MVSSGPVRAQLPAAPLRLEAAPTGGGVEEAGAGSAPLVMASGQDTVVDAPVVVSGLAPAPSSSPASPGWVSRPRPPASSEGGPEVVYPTGIIVAAEEHTLYQRSARQGEESSEVYVTLPEPELAEDGTEHDMVTYHSRAGTSGG